MNAREAAAAAEESIHALNYATMPWDRYPRLEFPSDVYDVVGSLGRMAGMLPQALSQVQNWITEQHAAGRIRHDEGGDLDGEISRLAFALGGAAAIATELHKVFNMAHLATAHLAYDEPGTES